MRALVQIHKKKYYNYKSITAELERDSLNYLKTQRLDIYFYICYTRIILSIEYKPVIIIGL